MAIDPNNASRILVPLGALAALAVAVGVWLVPSSALDPNPPDIKASTPPIPAPPVVVGQQQLEKKAWMHVADALEALRDADPNEKPKPDGGTSEPGQEETPTGSTPPPPRVTVAWEYEGLVEHADRVAALIRILGIQRFVYVGEPIEDSTLPEGTSATITEATPDHIVVQIDGGEQTIDRTDIAAPTRPATTPRRRQPGRTPPRSRKS